MIEGPAESLTRSHGGCEGWVDIVKLNYGRLPGFQFCIYHIMLVIDNIKYLKVRSI